MMRLSAFATTPAPFRPMLGVSKLSSTLSSSFLSSRARAPHHHHKQYGWTSEVFRTFSSSRRPRDSRRSLRRQQSRTTVLEREELPWHKEAGISREPSKLDHSLAPSGSAASEPQSQRVDETELTQVMRFCHFNSTAK